MPRYTATRSPLAPERLQRVRGPLHLVEQLGVGDAALVAGLTLPVVRDLRAVPGRDVAIEAVVRNVELPADEPLREREVPLAHGVPGLEPVERRRLLGPERVPIPVGCLVQTAIGHESVRDEIRRRRKVRPSWRSASRVSDMARTLPIHAISLIGRSERSRAHNNYARLGSVVPGHGGEMMRGWTQGECARTRARCRLRQPGRRRGARVGFGDARRVDRIRVGRRGQRLLALDALRGHAVRPRSCRRDRALRDRVDGNRRIRRLHRYLGHGHDRDRPTTAIVVVAINGDTNNEANETFAVNISAPTNAVLGFGAASATGTIINDDPSSGVQVSIGSSTIIEGNSGTRTFSMPVVLSKTSTSQVKVNYTTAPVTALAGSDYATKSGTATIAAGQTRTNVTVTETGDLTYEADETFSVVLSTPVGATIKAGIATATIRNDDAYPSTAWSWGDNTYGQLGDPSSPSILVTTPLQVATDTWAKLAAGHYHTAGIKTDGTLWAWGYNVFGQLGDGTTTDRTTPVPIGVDTDWSAVDAVSTTRPRSRRTAPSGRGGELLG